jgi:hypothetical protein
MCSSARFCELQGSALHLAHWGVIWPELIPALRNSLLRQGLSRFAYPRISLRIQITLQCGLVLGSTRASGRLSGCHGARARSR